MGQALVGETGEIPKSGPSLQLIEAVAETLKQI